jgi:hypothetical protein
MHACISYAEPLQRGQQRGVYATVGDQEHILIIEYYMEGGANGKGLGMNAVAEKAKRSARTVKLAIDRHRDFVKKFGICRICKRAEGIYAEDSLEKK